jgi:hypothetical protein
LLSVPWLREPLALATLLRNTVLLEPLPWLPVLSAREASVLSHPVIPQTSERPNRTQNS